MKGITRGVERRWRGRTGRAATGLAGVLVMAVLAGCGLMGERHDPFGTRSAPAVIGGPVSGPDLPRCVPEGGSCAADAARCCAGTTCAGGRAGTCIQAF